MERKRAALGDLSNSVVVEGVTAAATRRTRPRLEMTVATPSREEDAGDKVDVQRFTLVSRGAAPAKRAAPQHKLLLAPPGVAAQLGAEVPVCRCSECDRSGLRRRMSGTRLCRRNTEMHPEYALLLLMSERFEGECADRSGASELVTEACCREKTAYFILGAGSTTVGYVAAEVKANRKAKRANQSMLSDAGDDIAEPDEDVPTILQVYVEPEFRNRGYALEALKLLVRDQQSVKVDDPAASVLRMLERLGFVAAGTERNDAGRPITTCVKSAFFEDASF